MPPRAYLKEIDLPMPLDLSMCLDETSSPKVAFYFEEAGGNGVTQFLGEREIMQVVSDEGKILLLEVKNMNGLQISRQEDGLVLFDDDGWEVGKDFMAKLFVWTRPDDFCLN